MLSLVLPFIFVWVLAIGMPKMSCCFEADSIILLWYEKDREGVWVILPSRTMGLHLFSHHRVINHL